MPPQDLYFEESYIPELMIFVYMLSVALVSIVLVNLLIGMMGRRVTEIYEHKDTLNILERLSVMNLEEFYLFCKCTRKYDGFLTNKDASKTYVEVLEVGPPRDVPVNKSTGDGSCDHSHDGHSDIHHKHGYFEHSHHGKELNHMQSKNIISNDHNMNRGSQIEAEYAFVHNDDDELDLHRKHYQHFHEQNYHAYSPATHEDANPQPCGVVEPSLERVCTSESDIGC